MKTIKKVLVGIFAIFAILTFVSCKPSEDSGIKFARTTNEKLAYSATTALFMLDTEEVLAENYARILVEEEKSSSTVLETQTEETNNTSADYLVDIIEQADLILTNDSNFSLISFESDRDDYLNLNVISFIDFVGITHTFKLYYNDVTETVETDEDEVEIKVSYSGLVVYNEIEYSFDFESETETETDESEVKTKLKIYRGENSYISIMNEYEIEEDEREEKFIYNVIENNENIVSYSISSEIENDQTSVKVTINGEFIEIEEVAKEDKHFISLKDDKYEAIFERYEDENGHHIYHLVESDFDPNYHYDEMIKHFEERFKGFEEVFK